MNGNTGNGREELSMDWVRSQLRAIAAVEPPQSLRDRVLAGIPAGAAREPATHCGWAWFRRARWAGAAAAAIVTVSIGAWLGTPWGRQLHSAVDVNSHPGRAYATDHNGLRPSDMNLCDTNGIR
jgi:hypothetical protein